MNNNNMKNIFHFQALSQGKYKQDYYRVVFDRDDFKCCKYFPIDKLEDAKAYRDKVQEELDRRENVPSFRNLCGAAPYYHFPNNLVKDLLKRSEVFVSAQDLNIICDNFEFNLNYLFDNKYTDFYYREIPDIKNLFFKYYKKEKNIYELSNEYNVTKQYISKVLNNLTEALCSDYYKDFWILGIDKALDKQNYISYAVLRKKELDENFENNTITVLELSNKASRVLQRLGVVYIKDLRGLSTEDVFNAYYCSKLTATEIIDKVHLTCGFGLFLNEKN